MTKKKHTTRLYAYWVYRTRSELSVWQIVPSSQADTRASESYAFRHPDIYLKCIIDTNSDEDQAAEVGRVYPYKAEQLTTMDWTYCTKEDIPLVLLGDL